MNKLTIINIISLVLTSCYYDREEQLYPATGPCETTNVTYVNTVLPVLQNSACIGCHSGGAPAGNISLEGFDNVRAAALNGRLYGAISHSPGYAPMPQGGNKLSNCNINKIKAWIDAGAANN